MNAIFRYPFWKPNINTLLTVGGILIAVGMVRQMINQHDLEIAEIKTNLKAVLFTVNDVNVRLAKMETALEWMQRGEPRKASQVNLDR